MINQMTSFRETGLKNELLEALDDLNFHTPTPIQSETLGLLLHSEIDLVGLAQTGTGKTAAFSLPIINQIDTGSKRIQSIVLCPTRELCLQIGNDVAKYAKYIPAFRSLCVYGGVPLTKQVKALKKKCHMVIGTPGRTLDLIRRGCLDLSEVRWLVLDEADEMLNMGFKEDLNAILATTPRNKQTLLFSATMPKEISEIAQKYMDAPIEISVGKKNSGAENLSHVYYFTPPRDRFHTLQIVIASEPNIYAIVFCRTRSETKDVAAKLRKNGFNADALHGELSQGQRDVVMQKFRRREINIMVATDVAARGLDVDKISHVIHFNLPDELDGYIHRSGRSGRAGLKGESIALVHRRELGKIRKLEKRIQKKFIPKELPSMADIQKKKLFQFIDKIENAKVPSDLIDEILPELMNKLSWLSKEELLSRMLSLEMNKYKISAPRQASHKEKERKQRKTNGEKKHKKRTAFNNGVNGFQFTRFHASIGSKNGLDPPSLLGLINEQMRDDSFAIGQIEIFKSFAFFEIESEFADLLQKTMKRAKFKGQKFNIQRAKPKRF